MKPGDVCLVDFPFTDGTSSKMRPVLVISKEEFNRGADIVVLPISSKPGSNDPFAIFIDASHYAQAGLKVPSAIKWSKPITIAKSAIKRRLGALDSTLLSEVRTSVNSLFS
jgi:mRNA interferase MazF